MAPRGSTRTSACAADSVYRRSPTSTCAGRAIGATTAAARALERLLPSQATDIHARDACPDRQLLSTTSGGPRKCSDSGNSNECKRDYGDESDARHKGFRLMQSATPSTPPPALRRLG